MRSWQGMNGISPWAKAQAASVRDRMLTNGKTRFHKYGLVPGTVGDVPDFIPALAYAPARFHSIKADDVPTKYKMETRKLFRIASPSGYRFQTSVGGPLLMIAERDQITNGGRTFDVLGVEESPGGDELLMYIYVAEVV
jgi:hypothetical protein